MENFSTVKTLASQITLNKMIKGHEQYHDILDKSRWVVTLKRRVEKDYHIRAQFESVKIFINQKPTNREDLINSAENDDSTLNNCDCGDSLSLVGAQAHKLVLHLPLLLLTISRSGYELQHLASHIVDVLQILFPHKLFRNLHLTFNVEVLFCEKTYEYNAVLPKHSLSHEFEANFVQRIQVFESLTLFKIEVLSEKTIILDFFRVLDFRCFKASESQQKMLPFHFAADRRKFYLDFHRLNESSLTSKDEISTEHVGRLGRRMRSAASPKRIS